MAASAKPKPTKPKRHTSQSWGRYDQAGNLLGTHASRSKARAAGEGRVTRVRVTVTPL